MDLLRLESSLRASPAPEVSEIKEFLALIRRDRGSPGDSQGRAKQRAARELAYIFHMNSPQSPYGQYAPELREEKVVVDLFPPDWNWKKDDILQEAEDKYRELSETELTRMLRSARFAVNKITDYLDQVSFEPRDGESASDISEVMKVFKELKGVVDTLEDLQERVNKQMGEGARIKGGARLNKFNR